MNKVLITGASGFIGKNTAALFLENGFNVVGWDRNEAHSPCLVKSVNMLDEKETVDMLEKDKPDIIIHCAGSADVGKSVENPLQDYNGNVTITHHLLFALHKLGLNKTRLVYLSSASVYGNPEVLPITEDTPLNPLSPYAVHKEMCEELCRFFIRNYNMNIKIARIFSAYGAGLKKQIFWDMYHKYIDTGKLQMFGTGQESRDYIHVKDVAQSIFLLATTDSKETIFNIANGNETTIKEVTDIFADFIGLAKKNISFNGIVREGDPLNWRADISRIRKTGYTTTMDMRDGIKEYVEWVRNLKV